MIYILVIITIIYITLILSFCLAYEKVTYFKYVPETPKTTFSIIIPFRNEAKYLPNLLTSISKLQYPNNLFEIILIDDDSDDESLNIIMSFINDLKLSKNDISINVINNQRFSNSPKKDAITLAIKHAKHDWVITTDADCILPKKWLNTFNAFIQKKDVKLIVGPLTYKTTNSFLDTFQLLDILSLQSTTVSGFGLKTPFLCNGANLAYTKKTFNTLEGFKGNTNISSGDDIFLLEKAVDKIPKYISYLKSKEAIVKTYPEFSFKSLLQQRIRWAAKTSSYNNSFGKLVGFIVLLMNVSLVIGFFLSITNIINFVYICIAFLLKFTLDFWCIYKSASFFNQTKSLIWYPLSSLMYPFFSVFVAVYSIFSGYTWKRRSFQK